MMPRISTDGATPNMQPNQGSDPYGQAQYGGSGGGSGGGSSTGGRPSTGSMNRGNFSGSTGPFSEPQQQQLPPGGSTRRFTISAGPEMGLGESQQIPMQGGGMSSGMGAVAGSGGGDLMGNHSQRSQQSHPYHHRGGGGDLQSNSPNNPNSMSQSYYGSEQLSPTHLAHRMSLGFYPMSGGSATSQNFGGIDPMDLSGRGGSGGGGGGLPSAAPPMGTGAPFTQADREEELLLNLLIARRQRGRITGEKGGRSQASLADDLMRLRQSRAAASSSGLQNQQQHRNSGGGGGGIPQMPGMPPLYADSIPPGGSVPPNMYPGSSMDVYHRGGNVLKSDILPPQQQQQHMRQMQDTAERIDRSPNRFTMTDARMSEMRELSERGLKRTLGSMGMGSMGGGGGGMGVMGSMGGGGMPMMFDTAGYGNYQPSIEDTGPPSKKKRTHKKKPADMPRRPLSAYNLFFSEERERILKEIEKKEGKEGDEGEDEKPADEEEGADVKQVGDDGEEKPKALMRPLLPSQKKRRPHRKTHGKISFQQLARMVGERWKGLPEDERKYYQDSAQEDMKRQKLAMEEYYAKQNASKAKPNEMKQIEDSTEPLGTNYNEV